MEPFGSAASGISTKESDLDVCLFVEGNSVEERQNTAGEKVFYPKEFAELLRKSIAIFYTFDTIKVE